MIGVLEAIRSMHEDAEIWFDASPTIFQEWSDNSISTKALEPTDFDGVTTNPRIICECLVGQKLFWLDTLQTIVDEEPFADVELLYKRLYAEVIRQGARLYMDQWQTTSAKNGWVCAQVDPRHVLDSQLMYEEGIELQGISENVMVKVPGSEPGYRAIEKLTARGISVNNTFSYTVPQVLRCLYAMERGMEAGIARGATYENWRCVITFMIGRYGAQGDLLEQAKARSIRLSEEDIRWAEIAIFRKMLKVVRDSGLPVKLLLSSIKTDDDFQGNRTCWHLEKTAGEPIVYTMTPDLLGRLRQEFYRHDRIGATQEEIPPEVMRRLAKIPYFLQAYQADGISSQCFHRLAPFIVTASEANAATRRMIDIVALARQARTIASREIASLKQTSSA